jgi:hypothetical protein
MLWELNTQITRSSGVGRLLEPYRVIKSINSGLSRPLPIATLPDSTGRNEDRVITIYVLIQSKSRAHLKGH